MSVEIWLPPVLQAGLDVDSTLSVSAGTVGEVLEEGCLEIEGLRERLFSREGNLHAFVVICLGNRALVRETALTVPAPDGSVVSIMSAVAGG